MFKGYNLFGADTKSKRKERTEAERIKWLNKDLFKNKKLLADRNRPRQDYVTKVVSETRKKFRDISHRFSSKNDLWDGTKENLLFVCDLRTIVLKKWNKYR